MASDLHSLGQLGHPPISGWQQQLASQNGSDSPRFLNSSAIEEWPALPKKPLTTPMPIAECSLPKWPSVQSGGERRRSKTVTGKPALRKEGQQPMKIDQPKPSDETDSSKAVESAPPTMEMKSERPPGLPEMDLKSKRPPGLPEMEMESKRPSGLPEVEPKETLSGPERPQVSVLDDASQQKLTESEQASRWPKADATENILKAAEGSLPSEQSSTAPGWTTPPEASIKERTAGWPNLEGEEQPVPAFEWPSMEEEQGRIESVERRKPEHPPQWPEFDQQGEPSSSESWGQMEPTSHLVAGWEPEAPNLEEWGSEKPAEIPWGPESKGGMPWGTIKPSYPAGKKAWPASTDVMRIVKDSYRDEHEYDLSEEEPFPGDRDQDLEQRRAGEPEQLMIEKDSMLCELSTLKTGLESMGNYIEGFVAKIQGMQNSLDRLQQQLIGSGGGSLWSSGLGTMQIHGWGDNSKLMESDADRFRCAGC